MVRIKIKGIVHRARRMVIWDIERLKVIVVALNLGACGRRKACLTEKVLHTLGDQGDRMQVALCAWARRQGDVDALAVKPCQQRCLCQPICLLIQGGAQLSADTVQISAISFFGVGIQSTHLLRQADVVAFFAL